MKERERSKRERERQKGKVNIHTCSDISFLFIKEIWGAVSGV